MMVYGDISAHSLHQTRGSNHFYPATSAVGWEQPVAKGYCRPETDGHFGRKMVSLLYEVRGSQMSTERCLDRSALPDQMEMKLEPRALLTEGARLVAMFEGLSMESDDEILFFV